jgi:hypothetical protein
MGHHGFNHIVGSDAKKSPGKGVPPRKGFFGKDKGFLRESPPQGGRTSAKKLIVKLFLKKDYLGFSYILLDSLMITF